MTSRLICVLCVIAVFCAACERETVDPTTADPPGRAGDTADADASATVTEAVEKPLTAPGANDGTSAGAADKPARAIGPIDGSRDYHSFAEPDRFRVRHVNLDLDVDFDARRLHGFATLTVDRIDPVARELVLDTRDLSIRKIAVRRPGGDWAEASFSLGANDPNLGTPLTIVLDATDADTVEVRIAYATAPSASGLQWLSPAQTAGKKHPFLFTQSQAIHARSWIPLQDTPAVRVTYDAVISTPRALRAVMSAENDPASPLDGEFSFEMPQPIPSYLVALGIGDLRFKAMGERTGVYAEPALLDAAAAEFEDTEAMLERSETLFGPYRWGRYDLLILPPSFPFGGMENPRLSFITPTVIAGDKSLVALIAHELAHSWSGNLVTNATWRDLWLNEGFTSFLTSRIMAEIYGERRAAMEDLLNWQKLRAEMEELPDADEWLAIDLRGRDPDDVFSDVPYQKGKLLLRWIESRVGRDAFDAFLVKYFSSFAFESITTDEFLDYLDRQLVSQFPGAISMDEVREWVFGPGIPPNAVLPESDALDKVAAQSARWLLGEATARELNTAEWSVHEWRYFLNNLPRALSYEQLAELDSAFALTTSRNNEVAHIWLRIAIENDYEPAFDRLRDYLVSIGRRKLIVPLYEALMTTPEGAAFAREVYAQARPGYHPLAQGTVDRIVRGDIG